MRSHFRWPLVTALLLLSAQACLAAKVTDEQLVATLRRGVDYLLAQRKNDTWESPGKSSKCEWGDMTGGSTALALYALLHVGRSLDDERLNHPSGPLAPSIAWLSRQEPRSNYVASYQILGLVNAPPKPEVRQAIERAHNYLKRSFLPVGAYGYRIREGRIHEPAPNFWCNSNTQMAVLALWAADDYGLEISQDQWNRLDRHWRQVQCSSGEWDYREESETARWKNRRVAMTPAGVASLMITTDFVDNQVRVVAKPDPNLDNGIAAMVRSFNPNSDDLYYLYGCERVGLAGGIKHFGTVDWFQESAAALLKRQQADGSFTSSFLGSDSTVATAFALLFLARGRNPVAFNKLDYSNPQDPATLCWNARRRDVANLTHWMDTRFEAPLNWQVVNLKVEADAWNDAPVLVITGSRDPKFSAADIAKLRRFVLQGGLIFSVADGGAAEFTAAVETYAGQVAEGKFELRELPASHPVYSLVRKVPTTRVRGLSNGVREWWIHSPADLGAAWQKHAYTRTEFFDLPLNVFFYAWAKEAGIRAKRAEPAAATAVTNSGSPREVRLTRVQYDGNWDPEPDAWPRLVRNARRSAGLNVKLNVSAIADLDAKTMPLAHLAGPQRPTLSPAEQAKLKTYLTDGGTLLLEDIGGGNRFTDGIKSQLQAILPEGMLVPIPSDDPLLTGGPRGALAAMSYRRFAAMHSGPTDSPPLFGIKQNNRWCVILSSCDFTSGLLGLNTWGINGYAPDSAQRLACHLIVQCAGPAGVK